MSRSVNKKLPKLPAVRDFVHDFEKELKENHTYLLEIKDEKIKQQNIMRLLYTFNNGMFLKYTSKGQSNILKSPELFSGLDEKQISNLRKYAESRLESLENKEKTVISKLRSLRRRRGIVSPGQNDGNIRPLDETPSVSQERFNLVSGSRRNPNKTVSMIRKGGKKTRKNTNWIQFVKNVYNEEKKINKNFTYKEAMKKAASMR